MPCQQSCISCAHSGSQPSVDASAPDAAVDAGPATCPTGTKPTATFKGNTDLGNGQSEQTTSVTLTADKDWELDGQVFVKSGATLTIEPCVTIKGKVGTAATIIVKPGAKIMAKGEAERPIVFTSGAATKRPGDVGGLIVLGRAPVNQAAPTIEGLPVSAETTFGGSIAAGLVITQLVQSRAQALRSSARGRGSRGAKRDRAAEEAPSPDGQDGFE